MPGTPVLSQGQQPEPDWILFPSPSGVLLGVLLFETIVGSILLSYTLQLLIGRAQEEIEEQMEKEMRGEENIKECYCYRSVPEEEITSEVKPLLSLALHQRNIQ